MALDKICIEGLQVQCVVGCNPDERIRTQQVIAHITLFVDISECGRSDALEHTVNYSSIAKRVSNVCKQSQAYTLEALATQVCRDILFADGCERIQRLCVRLEKPEALKSAKWPAVEIERDRQYFFREDSRALREFGTSHMAASPQSNGCAAAPQLESAPAASSSGAAAGSTQPQAHDGGGSSPDGIVAYLALGSNLGNRTANIRRALQLLEITCSRPGLPSGKWLRVTDVSFLYETPPAYVTDQPAFLNGAAAAVTNLSPHELLQHIKTNVEDAMGREKSIRFGPRCIDVDILLYGPGQVISDGDHLAVPHPRMAERDFALGPLADIAPEYVHPSFGVSVKEMLRRLPSVQLQRVLAVSRAAHQDGAQVPRSNGGSIKDVVMPLGGRTLVMGILNITPDSFSDGGQFDNVEAAVGRARAMVEAGVDVIDVGGQSTRPGSTLLSADEESGRVLPVILAVRAYLDGRAAATAPAVAATSPSSAGSTKPVLISVDTFYSAVATAAVSAGADLVNDVSGGTMDAAMLTSVAALGVPYVAMHMRGTPQTMASLATYAPAQPADAQPDSGSAPTDAAGEAAAVVADVRSHLANRASAALAAGIRRWNLILDPGLGFAKNTVHNFALLRPDARLTSLGFPLLYGPSRKRFIGDVTGKAVAADRAWGTVAAVTASIAVGASIVRVHDVEGMVDAVKVADAIYRL